MTTALPTVPLLRPDRRFVEAVIASGGADLKKCFQCATCSVVCGLSAAHAAFPRKEMLWAQWGLKDRLVADPDVWTCHQCNDCSLRCPRNARPGDVLAAVRRQVVEHYAFPRVLGRMVNRPATFAVLLFVPLALLLAALAARDPLGRLIGAGRPEGFYAEFFPHWLLIGFFTLFTGLAGAAAVLGGLRFWRAMEAADAGRADARPVMDLWPAVRRALGSAFRHDRFSTCTERASRRTTHLLAFYGFLALFATTAWAVVDMYVFPLLGIAPGYPYGLAHPVKWVANLGALLLIVGAGKAIRDRMAGDRGTPNSTAFDWIFPGLLLGIGVTGLPLEVLRYVAEGGARSAVETPAYSLYVIHLVLVFALLVYLPYSKFAHVVYRLVASVYSERTGRGADAGPPAGRAGGGAAPGSGTNVVI